MSAPDTNVEKQTKRHKGPLTGMPAAIVLAVVAIVGAIAWINFTGIEDEVDTGVTTSTEAQGGTSGATATE
ncbi:hypothetical protein EI983_12365 [Roseovarius faecimaris]|uniref:Uncharacterized protein n=1 Tax=Roseovarius faecimaris TaxID=2494550 RepID=A0A6I6IPP6_9RHOB|nr:hypothetical protein [Roseovarius faecimaris]QGX99019.1 hypothetical protein EI983_12365 [Roseovarius faecimaris]